MRERVCVFESESEGERVSERSRERAREIKRERSGYRVCIC